MINIKNRCFNTFAYSLKYWCRSSSKGKDDTLLEALVKRYVYSFRACSLLMIHSAAVWRGKKLQLRIRRTCCGTAAVFTLELRKELDWQEASRFVTPGRAGAAMCRANCANKSLHFWEEGGFVSWNPVKMPLHSNLDRSLCCLFIRKPHGPECEQRKSSSPALASRRRDRG